MPGAQYVTRNLTRTANAPILSRCHGGLAAQNRHCPSLDINLARNYLFNTSNRANALAVIDSEIFCCLAAAPRRRTIIQGELDIVVERLPTAAQMACTCN